MGTNLDYLNPDLLPLERKVAAYLETEEQLRQLDVAAHNAGANTPPTPRPSTNEPPQEEQFQQSEEALQSQLNQLREDILQLLPTRDEWVKINLGYGPSRVGAFRLDHPDEGQPPYMIRIVH